VTQDDAPTPEDRPQLAVAPSPISGRGVILPVPGRLFLTGWTIPGLSGCVRIVLWMILFHAAGFLRKLVLVSVHARAIPRRRDVNRTAIATGFTGSSWSSSLLTETCANRVVREGSPLCTARGHLGAEQR